MWCGVRVVGSMARSLALGGNASTPRFKPRPTRFWAPARLLITPHVAMSVVSRASLSRWAQESGAPRGTRGMRAAGFDAPGERGPGRTGRAWGRHAMVGALGHRVPPDVPRHEGCLTRGFAACPLRFPVRSGVESCVQGRFPDRYRGILRYSGILP